MKLLGPLLCALAIAAAQPAFADVSRDDAAAMAQRMAGGGRVLSVDRAGNAWRVKIVTSQGQVRVIMIDAASGRPV
jgi:uncharacterized membrane protein YkoI